MTKLIALAVLCGILAVAPLDAIGAAGSCAGVRVVAHRGETARYIENSVRSVQAALDEGVAAEVDLRTTLDGKLMLMHDRRVTRTTNGRGPVSRLRSGTIRGFRLNDGQRVPFASGILGRIRDTPRAHIVLDLKRLTSRSQRNLAGMINRYQIASRVRVISLYRPQLAAFRARNPGVHTFYIAPGLPSVKRSAALGGVAVWANAITPVWAAHMQARSLRFGIRMADDSAAWRKSGRFGADFAVTDRARSMRAYCS